MNEFAKYILMAVGANVLLTAIFSIPLFTSKELGSAIGGLIFLSISSIISLSIQLIAGLSFLSDGKKKRIGQAMILTVGIFALIGLSICSRR